MIPNTPLEVQLSVLLAGWVGAVVGWLLCGLSNDWQHKSENRKIEKSGVWRCEDRGYYLVKQNRFGGEQEGYVVKK